MKKYRLSIYTIPDTETRLDKDVDEIGQGMIIAKCYGYQEWVHCRELKNLQWHIHTNEGFSKKDEINFVIGRYTPNGDLIVSNIQTKE